jgi:hypothetical protein
MGKVARFVLLSCGVLAALGVLYGCGQANSPVEWQEKKHGVEEVGREEREQPKTVTPPAPDTPQEIEAMSDEDTMRFTNCQFSKMMEDRGRAATEQWAKEWGRQTAKKIARDEPGPTLQEALLAEGYTCTPEEVQEVLAAQSASAEATARAIAEEEAQTEKEWAASARARADEVQLSAEGECRIEEYAREEDFKPDLLKVNVSDYMKAEGASEEKALTFFNVPHYASCS